MRISFVSPTVNLGGGTKVIVIYAKALVAQGHHVELVSPPRQVLTLRQKLQSLIKGNGWPKKLLELKSHLDGSGLNHRILDRYRPVTDADMPEADIVIATWWETAEWVNTFKKNKGVKVYFIQGHEIFPHLPVERCHATYRLPMHKIVVARWLKEVMRTQYGDNSVDVVSNSVDKNQFFAPVRDKQSVPTLGFFYTLSPSKGMSMSLAGIEILRKKFPHLRVICFASQYPNPAFPVPEGTEFTLSPDQDRIKDLYSQCDVWITTSRSEGFNLMAMEAMACRTPIVSTRTGWPEEALKSGHNGMLIEVDDLAALVHGAEWILSLQESDWSNLSLNAYNTVAFGSWKESTKKFERILQSLCSPSITHLDKVD